MRRYTVIIPAYNVGPYLAECLDSVCRSVAQAPAEFEVEIVCVDDGSTDSTAQIIDDFSARPHNRVTVKAIHQANKGVSAARNRALDDATGDWLLFLDGDDLVRETWLQDVDAVVDSNPEVDLIGFGTLPYYGGEVAWGTEDGELVDVGIDHQIVDRLAGMSVYCFAYRRKIFADLRFTALPVGEDLIYTASVFSRAQHCLVFARREYLYRYREGSATHTDISAERMQQIIAFNVPMFLALTASNKRVGRAFTQGRGREWIATLPRIILSKGVEPGWDGAWKDWLDSMSVAARLSIFNFRQRFMATMASRVRSRFLVQLLLSLRLGR